MHDPTVGTDAGSVELLGLVGGLADPERRQEVAAELARRLGGESLLLFAPDPELGVLLPAPGLPQVLRGAGPWREFLEHCARDGSHTGTVPVPDGPPILARGCALEDGTAAVLVGMAGAGSGPEFLRPFLPLLGALFGRERKVAADEVRARAADEAAARAQVLTGALQRMRELLEIALVEADEARKAAESLATELQAQTDQLQEQAVELELLNDELAVRTGEAEHERAAADAANRAKSEFLANMSHELRTPINAVIGYAELLDMGITGPVTGEQKAQLERIRASSAHLLSLVNDVLDLAKVEAGHMTVEHEREPAAAVVTQAIDLISGQAVVRRISLRNECQDSSLFYVGDRDRVWQILVNLLSNAVKFTEPGGAVTVFCGSTVRPENPAHLSGDGPWVRISVEDNGIGIAPDELARVFRPFEQAESGHTRSHGGTGLGLTISRRFARLMGGDLTARSQKGRGSCFTLWLPAAALGSGSVDSTLRIGAASPDVSP